MPPIEEFCFYNIHQYYNVQGGLCKLCDRCPIGLGLASFKDRKFEIDPQHGALACLHCVRCTNGFYSNDFSYDGCKPCIDCQKLGRFEISPCSSTQNAVCGPTLPKRPEKSRQDSDNNLSTTLAIGLPSFLILAVVVAVVLYLCLKKRETNERIQSESGGTTRALISTKESTSTLSTGCNESESMGSRDISTDGSCIEDMTTVIEQWKLRHDSEEELSHIHARMICKFMITKNIFHDIGLRLGVPDIDIQIILADKHGVEEQAYATLIKWKQLKASDATVFKFLDVLLCLELHGIARTFCEKYNAHLGNL